MHTVASALAYRAFATTFEATQASIHRREHILQVPGRRRRDKNPDKQEFFAKVNIHFDGYNKTTRKVSADDERSRRQMSPQLQS